MKSIDLNCDLGEGCPNDAELMKYVSSINVACGYHAGDEETMTRTVELAAARGIAVGAHPSYPDRENFGRTSMELSEQGSLRHRFGADIYARSDLCGDRHEIIARKAARCPV